MAFGVQGRGAVQVLCPLCLVLQVPGSTQQLLACLDYRFADVYQQPALTYRIE